MKQIEVLDQKNPRQAFDDYFKALDKAVKFKIPKGILPLPGVLPWLVAVNLANVPDWVLFGSVVLGLVAAATSLVLLTATLPKLYWVKLGDIELRMRQKMPIITLRPTRVDTEFGVKTGYFLSASNWPLGLKLPYSYNAKTAYFETSSAALAWAEEFYGHYTAKLAKLAIQSLRGLQNDSKKAGRVLQASAVVK